MSKLILCLDGGGIRGAATTQFLAHVEKILLDEHGISLRDCVDYYAGTSTGGIIALALATTDISMAQINRLYNHRSGKAIFAENRGFFEIDGINAPRYEGKGKTQFLKRWFNDATLSNAAKRQRHVLTVTFAVERHQPLVIKSHHPEHVHLNSFDVADATSAAPTYFPSRPIPLGAPPEQRWLIDGGVVANNPTLCAVAEVQQLWPGIRTEEITVLSVGTGKRTRKINGPSTRGWGAYQWIRQGQIIDVLSDEQLVAYQAKAILADGNYIRVNASMREQPGLPMPPDDAMDDYSKDNIARLKKMGDFWFQQYGKAVVDMLLGQYKGPSLDAINSQTGRPG
ncbi:patatin-like phospholipase family protein [Salinimonas sp. HHU 13199]|uniref:Patatin-like phospholipase family protein n=1 Tax=Salinimonas profundi TaxID=2729140 RepID=A0ABR8LJB5_9ALTE|nr:patatin-like phospholipase family protein [Salinimonas profundi]MBD3586300.1 patatin-like phospholipase family protein [Salinimonas profundi]